MSINSADARHLLITGVVQGVGFRYHMTETARRLGIGGWVRNCSDGSVEAIIVGTANALAEMINWSSHGPIGAYVNQVLLEQVEHPPIFHGFNSRPTKQALS